MNCINRNGEITGYILRAERAGEGTKFINVLHDARQATFSGLTPSSAYSVSIAAQNNAGTGVYSGPIVKQTLGKYE